MWPLDAKPVAPFNIPRTQLRPERGVSLGAHQVVAQIHAEAAKAEAELKAAFDQNEAERRAAVDKVNADRRELYKQQCDMFRSTKKMHRAEVRRRPPRNYRESAGKSRRALGVVVRMCARNRFVGTRATMR